MRVLFTVSDWPAHYFPMVPLGWALQAAGHEVRVACAPSQVTAVSGAGLSAVPVLGDLDMVFLARFQNLTDIRAGTWRYPELPGLHPDTGEELAGLDGFDFETYATECRRRIARETATGVAGVLELVRSWRPDLVVHDRLSMEGVLAARALGVPHVAHLWGPVGTAESDPRLHPLPVDYTRAFPRNGLPEMGPELIEYVIDPCPPSLAPPTRATRLPVRYVPYNGPGAMEPWALEPPARPRVCVLWSNSVSTSYGAGSYLAPRVVRALAGLDVEVVVPVHPDDAARLGELPPNVRTVERFPLHLLLPSCAAIVHHGGAGTVMTAAAAGVPQLALTFGPEQDADGGRLAATGAGLHITGDRATEAAVRGAVAALLGGPTHRAAAGRLAGENAARPVPADLVGPLERLAATGELPEPAATGPAAAAGQP
ncbi:UDP:flavonoid glycosyltransferase YjiC, YdhE family [Streptomyces misionensis]|uniref:UDP:flavonoid glycosyltransferase YjiC, YdhE family n=1 Tax=Streptomyces misionensis TaxID=67331 RepID=A0A1H4IC14_9ACTN|nr:nucleotide disphospho-sugar-binding domain-containing protein [Streptomyces misionensis]SEB30878.1 UDP:flavonoid glycosyltransferase YjiC, YdhE family [Streptomyces misionensis]